MLVVVLLHVHTQPTIGGQTTREKPHDIDASGAFPKYRSCMTCMRLYAYPKAPPGAPSDLHTGQSSMSSHPIHRLVSVPARTIAAVAVCGTLRFPSGPDPHPGQRILSGSQPGRTRTVTGITCNWGRPRLPRRALPETPGGRPALSRATSSWAHRRPDRDRPASRSTWRHGRAEADLRAFLAEDPSRSVIGPRANPTAASGCHPAWWKPGGDGRAGAQPARRPVPPAAGSCGESPASPETHPAAAAPKCAQCQRGSSCRN
jgi:hypothetical protein